MAPDYSTLQRLALIKQVYANAVLQAKQRYSASARLLAVINFDWSAESMAKAALLYFKSSPNSLPDNLSALVQSVNKALSKAGLEELPDASRVERVRRIRNASQHEARIPSDEEVIECQMLTRDFLEAACMMVWGITLQSISLASLVRDQTIRDILMEAELAAAKGDSQSATAASGVAIAKQLNRLRAEVLGPPMDEATGFVRSTVQFRACNPEELGYLYSDTDAATAINMMQTTTLLSLIGSNLREYTFFTTLTGHVAIMADGSAHITNPKKVTKADAEFALAYAMNLALKIEEYLGFMLDSGNTEAEA